MQFFGHPVGSRKIFLYRDTREVHCNNFLLPWIRSVWLCLGGGVGIVKGAAQCPNFMSCERCPKQFLSRSQQEPALLWIFESWGEKSGKWYYFPIITLDEGCFPSCCSPDGRVFAKAVPVINVGPDVRCSASFVEGKGQEMTYKLQSLKGTWITKGDKSNISPCTTKV